MISTARLMSSVVAVCAVAVLCPARADDVKAIDEGKATEFRGKKFEMKDKGQVAVLLSLEAGKEVEATTNGLEQTDVHLYVYDEQGKTVGMDDSPTPDCSVKFTPATDGKYKFLIKNWKGDNTVTFQVKPAKSPGGGDARSPQADDVKAIDEGKATEFRGKKFEMKDKGQVAVLLSLEAGKEVEATTNGLEQTDVHLYVYDEQGKTVGMDDSPTPDCSVKFTPATDGKYKFLIKNWKGDNTVTFQVKPAR